jgi:hypothetical protein
VKDYETALQHDLLSLELCKELGDQWGTVYILRHIGKIYMNLEQPDRARKTWLQALDVAQSLQHPIVESLQELLGLGPETAS